MAQPASEAASDTSSTTLSAVAFALWLLVYVLVSWLGLYFDDGSGLVSMLWPAAGVAAALVLRYGLTALWLPVIGQLLALQIAGYVWDMPWFASIGGGVGSALANAGATWLVYRLFEGQQPVRLHDSHTFLKFAVVVAPIASAFSAMVGIATLLAFSQMALLDPLTRITLWWSGDMVGYLLVTPVLLTWSERKLSTAAMFEFFSLMLLSAGFLALLLLTDALTFAARILLAPFGLLLLFWALVRLRLFFLNLLLLFTGLMFVLVHREDGGPFQLGDPVLSHLALQAFLVALTVGTVAIATLLRERRQLNQALLATNQTLEAQVRERTERLEQQATQMRDIVNALPIHLSVRSDDGDILLSNQVLPALRDQELPWLRKARLLVSSTGRPEAIARVDWLDPDTGTRTLQAQVLPLRGNQKPDILLLATDITEQTRQQQRSRLQAQMLKRLADEVPLTMLLQEMIDDMALEDAERDIALALVERPPAGVLWLASSGMPVRVRESLQVQTLQPDQAPKLTGSEVVVLAEALYDSAGEWLGWLLYHCRQQRETQAVAQQELRAAAALASLLIERHRDQLYMRQVSRAVEQTTSAIVIADEVGRIERINARFGQMLAHTLDAVVGKPMLDLLLPNDADGRLVREAIGVAMAEGRAWQGEFAGNRGDGGRLWLRATFSPIRSKSHRIDNIVVVLEDISSVKAAHEQVEFLAFHDILTGLANRRLFTERVAEAIRRTRRVGALSALLFMDLDEFKRINDTLGHDAGDALLKQVSQRLLGSVREDDLVARFGGDEFCLLIGNLHDSIEAGTLAKKLLQAVTAPMTVLDHAITVTCSIGITLLPVDGDKVDELLRNADIAMYRAKSEGRNRFVFFSPEMNDASRQRLQLELDLRRGIGQKQFRLYYQPIVNMQSRTLAGFEVLLRWQHPKDGLMAPDQFIPVAEHTGLIVPIGEEVLHQALLELPTQRVQHPALRVSVNVSARQLRETDFASRVVAMMQDNQIPRGSLQLEITESLLLDRSELTDRNLIGLVEAGARIVIDDFGTGYTSFGQLRDLPIHGIKLDRRFVRGLPDNQDDAAIVAALIAMATQLKLDIVAEGVESEAQRAFLLQHGCLLGQGWLFGKPAPL